MHEHFDIFLFGYKYCVLVSFYPLSSVYVFGLEIGAGFYLLTWNVLKFKLTQNKCTVTDAKPINEYILRRDVFYVNLCGYRYFRSRSLARIFFFVFVPKHFCEIGQQTSCMFDQMTDMLFKGIVTISHGASTYVAFICPSLCTFVYLCQFYTI